MSSLHSPYKNIWWSLLALASLLLCSSFAEEQFKCPEQFGYYRDSRDCAKYYVCVLGDSHHEKCTGGLHFSLELQTCDWPRNVNCVTDELPSIKIRELDLEDEIFSSSLRTSAAASNEGAQQLKTVEKEPVSNCHNLEDNRGEESKGYAKITNDNQKSRLQNQHSQRVAITTEQSTPTQCESNLQLKFSGKSTTVKHPIENTSEDPLYASEDSKIPLDNYSQEPKFDEAAPLVDLAGGIHIADGGHGLDAFSRLSHHPRLGDFRVFEKPIYNANNDNQDRAQDYEQRNEELTLSTRTRSLEGYSTINAQSKDPDVVIDYSNGNSREINCDYQEQKNFDTPPTIFDDNADHRVNGGLDILTPIRHKRNSDSIYVKSDQSNKDSSDLEVLQPTTIPDLPRILQKGNLNVTPIDENLADFQKSNFDSDRNYQNNSVPEVQFDDQPSSFDRELSLLTQRVRFDSENPTKEFTVIDLERKEPVKNEKVEVNIDAFINNGKSRNPDAQFPDNPALRPNYSSFDIFTDVIHDPIRNVRPKNSHSQTSLLSPENPKFDEKIPVDFKGSSVGAKDVYPETPKDFSEDYKFGNPDLFPHQLNKSDDSKLIFPEQTLVKRFGSYTGNERHSKKLDSSSEFYSQNVNDPKDIPVKRRPIVPKHRQSQPDNVIPKTYDPSASYDEYVSSKQFTGDYTQKETPEFTKTTAIIRTRPIRQRKSTTTTTTTTTTPAPIKIRKRVPIGQVSKPTKPPFVAEATTPFVPPSRPINQNPTPQPYTQAQECDPIKCRLPDCRCGGSDIPGGFRVNEIPQLVLLTFDDAVNDLNKDLYDELFNSGRENPNGCPILGTFYVSHEWTDYGQVQNLYSNGHEIASHSITHSDGAKFSKNQWMRDIHGQREILHLYGGVRMEDIRGMRAPFLQTGGNEMFAMLYDANFTYDSSMPVRDNDPPFWPYTLDYSQNHECMISPCPTMSFPGLWEVGMVHWEDLIGGRCAMGDACSNPEDEEAVTEMLIKNFNRHYKSNRAPFGLFYHAAWFNTKHHRRGFMKFLDEILKKDDVWFVTNWQLIQWMRNPTPNRDMKNFEPFNCRRLDRPPPCRTATVCNIWYQGGVRYMKTCKPCPVKYPWVGSTGYDSNSRG